MKKATFVALLATCLLCACATVPTQRPNALTDEDYDMCDRAGGCVLIVKQRLLDLLKHIRDQALEACKDST